MAEVPKPIVSFIVRGREERPLSSEDSYVFPRGDVQHAGGVFPAKMGWPLQCRTCGTLGRLVAGVSFKDRYLVLLI